MEHNTWPPPYKLRYSARAKHANLKIHPTHGLEIVIPARRKNFDISRLLAEKRPWIEKHWLTITAANTPTPLELPTHIFIPSDKSLWNISYNKKIAHTDQPPPRLKLTVDVSLRTMVFAGNIQTSAVYEKLISWLKTYAYANLTARLQTLSLRTNLNYHKLAIRKQSTVWGSCNHKHHISLNLKLLFLPTVITDYVLLHELCHTRYLNHGRRFWQLVEKYNNNYKILEKYLKYGDKYLPNWLNIHV